MMIFLFCQPAIIYKKNELDVDEWRESKSF